MKKCLILLVTFAGATGIGWAARQAMHVSASASVRPDEPRARSADRPTILDKPAPAPARSEDVSALRFAAGLAPVEGDAAELLLARLAHDSGSYLLARAQSASGKARLLKQAALHFQACLGHESDGNNAGTLFRDARQKLVLAERLLVEANQPPSRKHEEQPIPKVAAKPAPTAAPVVEQRPAPTATTAPAPRPTGKMVGPEGVIYERAPERP